MTALSFVFCMKIVYFYTVTLKKKANNMILILKLAHNKITLRQ
jgi:hypothetical protein